MIQRLIVLCSMITFSISAQEMQEGFKYLETGKYDQATIFFKNILEQFPNDRTARLCYGRATGLSGNSKQAISIFTALLTEYQNDFEIKLNYAESLLWDQQYTRAESYYEKILQEDSSSFPAVLGYANTLSNLKKYEDALIWVNKALKIQKGNPNALISRKYIRLGYANILSQEKKYREALSVLDENLIDFPNDTDTQRNKANIYLVTNDLEHAENAYSAIATTTKDSIISLNGLALVAHKKGKEKKALSIATNSKTKVMLLKEDKELYLSTIERYIQALLWNRKFRESQANIDQLLSQYPDNSRVKTLQATHGMYTSNFKNSLDRYQSILNSDFDSFDGNLGIANAYRASGLDMKAYEYTFKTLQYYPKQPDAEKLIKTLKKFHTPFIVQKTTFTFDNGDNEAVNLSLSSEVPFYTQLKTTINYSYRTTKNAFTNNEATSHSASLGVNYKLNGKLSVLGTLGINNSDAFTRDYTQVTAEALLKTKPYRLQNLDLGYKRELQNFNAALIDREIVMNNYYLNYNLGTNFNLGWYTQYRYTSQSDNNTRNLLFTSLYYSILNRPVLKAGVNYQYIVFKNQVPTIYFSPERFNLGEVFVEVVSDPQKHWFYAVSVAVGKQFVEDIPASATFRTEAKFGHQFSDRFMANIYGKYSNIASATAAGFEYTEFGFKLKWYFSKQPIFNKKIMELKK